MPIETPAATAPALAAAIAAPTLTPCGARASESAKTSSAVFSIAAGLPDVSSMMSSYPRGDRGAASCQWPFQSGTRAKYT
ncbi:MAG: hypothetical protein ACRD3S_02585, partial [Terracidiphilus sp.]